MPRRREPDDTDIVERIEALEHPDRLHLFDAATEARMGMDEFHQVFTRFVPPIGGHEQPAGLVESDQQIVFKEDGRK